MPIKTIIVSEGVGLASPSSTETLATREAKGALEGDGFAKASSSSTETI